MKVRMKGVIRLNTIIFMIAILLSSNVSFVLVNSLNSKDHFSSNNTLDLDYSNHSSLEQNNLNNLRAPINQENSRVSYPQFPPNNNYLSKSDVWQRKPLKQPLKVSKLITTTDINGNKQILAIQLNPPSDFAFRGTTITVTGQLKSSIPGDYWDGETVYLYYNVTEDQYTADPSFYESNPNYYVGSDVTDSEGYFSIPLTTSTLTSEPFSKLGIITLFTWFDGNPSRGRGAGSPGSINVTFYGTMHLAVSASVTNPGPSSTYSYTTHVEFDNGTIVQTSGTQYHLKIEWSVDGVHTDTNYTFDSTNSHTYSNTPPNTVQTVTYQAWYDIGQLSIPYFTKEGATNPATEKTLYLTRQDQTEQQVVADGYFVVGSTKQKTAIEVALDSSFKIYANLSDENGAISGKTIVVSFRNDGTEFDSVSLVTNDTGEVEYTYTLNHAYFPDITKSFTIVFSPLASENPGATLTSTTLSANLAVNITSIDVTISNNNIYYTPGQLIQYTVVIKDEFGRNAPGALFNLTFPGQSWAQYTAPDGTKTFNHNVPDYTGADQTPSKTIFVEALNLTGSGYRYVVSGTVGDNDTFNIYFSLTMQLLDPLNNAVVSGSTWTEFNNTFASAFDTGSYNLSVLDQWGRKPIGAQIQIIFAGYTVTFYVNQTQNWVLYTKADLVSSGLNLSEPQNNLQLVARYGEYTYQDYIVQTINIYGPDIDAPILSISDITPNINQPLPHPPIFNVTFTIAATDTGTGVRYVLIWYQLWSADNTTPLTPWNFVNCTYVGGNTYIGHINVTFANAQQYVHYYLEVKDYAGWGLLANGTRQPTPQYDPDFGLSTYLYANAPQQYQLGDYAPPVEEQAPTVQTTLEPPTPFANITVYVNDSLIYSGISYVEIRINVTNVFTQELNNTIIANMTNIPGTNQWYYELYMEYNYNYTWYYVAYDSAYPTPRKYTSQLKYIDASDTNPPIIRSLVYRANTPTIEVNSIINFTVIVVDPETGLSNVSLIFNYLTNGTTIKMINIGNDTYFASVDLSTYPLPESSGTFNIVFFVRATDNSGNVAETRRTTVGVPYYPSNAPKGTGNTNIGAIIGGVVGGIVIIIVVLFIWYNRHSIRTYAAKQTLRRRLQDYLRDILDEIRRDGLEGRYREGLLKVWAVTEGIGREFYALPRYKSQTSGEFARRFAEKANIDRGILITIVEYFNKARYGHEKVTETDFNSGVRALHKLIEKLEEGEIRIES